MDGQWEGVVHAARDNPELEQTEEAVEENACENQVGVVHFEALAVKSQRQLDHNVEAKGNLHKRTRGKSSEKKGFVLLFVCLFGLFGLCLFLLTKIAMFNPT